MKCYGDCDACRRAEEKVIELERQVDSLTRENARLRLREHGLKQTLREAVELLA